MSDRIKSVMGLIRRYESLFQLPTRIVQETERGEFETVCSSCHVSCMRNLNYNSLSCFILDDASHARLAMQCKIVHNHRLCLATVDFSQPATWTNCHQLASICFVQRSTHSRWCLHTCNSCMCTGGE